MEIRLYKNFSKRKNSTKLPTGTYTSKVVTLKQSTSIIDPVFILTGYDRTYNYVYVPAWERYYFVNNFVLVHNDVYELHCSSDRLATFKSWIGLYNCFVERCSDSTKYNTDILDTALTVEDVVENHTQASTNLLTTTGAYIIRVLGRGPSGVQTFAFSNLSSVANIFNPIFSNMFDDGTFDWSTLNVGDLVQAILCDPSKYILGAYYSPVAFGTYVSHGTSQEVCLGFFPTGNNGQLVTSPILEDTLTLNKPSSIYTDFRKTDNAFSNYSLFLPAIGTVPLSADIMDSALTLDYAIDLLTGNIFYELKAGGVMVSTYNGNCYASLQIGSGDASGGTAFMSDIVSGALSISSGNLLAAGENIIDGIRNIITPTPAVNGSQGGVASLKTHNNVIISCLQKHSAEFPSSVYGRPCCKNLVLGTLTGFIKCAGASIDITGYEDDKEVVNGFLNSGFYYE